VTPGYYNRYQARFMITAYRYWTDRALVWSWMDKLRGMAYAGMRAGDADTIWGIGDCPTGGDLFGLDYLKAHGLNYERFEADWDRYGLAAGPMRNNHMIGVIRPTHTLAFLHPKSKGAVGCSDRAQLFSRVYRIYAPGVYTSTAAGQPVPPPFDWNRLT
jgi:hypothetical protein